MRLALDQLFVARHPELAATGSAHEAERASLFERMQAAKALASPIVPIDHQGPHHVEEIRQPVNFSREDRKRLQELANENTKLVAIRNDGASILREALAEGDLTSTLVTRDGREILIKAIIWRAEGGLEIVKSGRARVLLPFAIGQTYGEVVIKQSDIAGWLSNKFPKQITEKPVADLELTSHEANTDRSTTPLAKNYVRTKADEDREFERLINFVGGCVALANAGPILQAAKAKGIPFVVGGRETAAKAAPRAIDRESNAPTNIRGPRARLAITNKPGSGGKKKEAAIAKMVCSIREGTVTFSELKSSKQEALATLYPPSGGRSLLVEAREVALMQLVSEGYSDAIST